MRYIKMIIATVVGLVGMVSYFLSVPTIDEENLIEVAPEIGEANIFEDFYFSGYLNSQSVTFSHLAGETKILNQLPHLDWLDLPFSIELMELQAKYPDFTSSIYYDRNVTSSLFSNTDDYLIASYFQGYDNSERNYNRDLRSLYFKVLDKDSGEIKTAQASRENYLLGNSASILSMHQDYPVVKVLFEITNWNDDYYNQSATMIAGEYNLETMNYEEKTLDQIEGYYLYHGSGTRPTNVLDVWDRHIFTREGVTTARSEPYLEVVEEVQLMMYNFTDGSLQPLSNEIQYMFSDVGELFGINVVDGVYFLQKFDVNGEHVLDEVAIELDERIPMTVNFELDAYQGGTAHAGVFEGKLYLVYNQYEDYENPQPKPVIYQVFDAATGETVALGEINFDDTNSEIPTSGTIDRFGKNFDY